MLCLYRAVLVPIMSDNVTQLDRGRLHASGVVATEHYAAARWGGGKRTRLVPVQMRATGGREEKKLRLFLRRRNSVSLDAPRFAEVIFPYAFTGLS